MNSVWQQFTLYYSPLQECLDNSFIHRLVGLLRAWQKSSFLMQWADTIAAILLSLVYIITPFIPNNTTLVGILLAACVAFWLLITLSDEKEPGNIVGVTPIHFLVFLYWIATTISTGFSPVKKAAFADWINVTLLLMLFPLCVRVLQSKSCRSWLIAVYLHVSLIVSVYAMNQWHNHVPPLATWVDPDSSLSKATRVYSYLGNPNLLAGYILPAVVLSLMAVFVWRTRVRKALALTMFLLNTATLILTLSRGGWIALLVVVIALLVLLNYWWSDFISPFWRTWGLRLIFGSLIGLLLLTIVLLEPVRERISSMFAGRGDSSNNVRINVWISAREMIRAYPLGIGPGHTAFNKIYPLYQQGPRFSALSAYSIFLEVTVESGFFGLACFLWLLTVIFHTGFMQLQRLRKLRSEEGFWLIGAIVAIIGMLAHGTVDTVWYRPSVNTVWWLMVALIASYYTPISSDQTPQSEDC